MRLIISSIVLAVGLLLTPVASAAQETSLTKSASRVNTQIVTLISDYEDTYGPRVSATERRTLQKMERTTKRQMNTLVRLVREAERTERSSAWKRAYEHYRDIDAASEDGLAEMRAIIEPKMSWTDRLGAVSRARSIQGDMNSLGNQLKRRAR
jgi:hypothetical protein